MSGVTARPVEARAAEEAKGSANAAEPEPFAVGASLNTPARPTASLSSQVAGQGPEDGETDA
jgi:hypothetical protein